MNRSRAFPIVVVVPYPDSGTPFDLFLMGMVDGQVFWDDDKNMALRFSSAAAASQICARFEGAKIRVEFA